MKFPSCGFAPLLNIARRLSTTAQNLFKVAILGAAGNVGQPLTLMLKENPFISQLALYDVNNIVEGIACDASHCCSKSKVSGYCGEDKLCKALKGADVVIMAAGDTVPVDKNDKKKEDLFHENARIVHRLTCRIILHSPSAFLAVVTDPVNSIVPIISELMYRHGCYDPRKIFGVTSHDLICASKLAGEFNCCSCINQFVPVIGGHSEETMVPLLSQAWPSVNYCYRDLVLKRIRAAKSDAMEGSSNLSVAYATSCFTSSLLKALKGEGYVTEFAYVRSNDCPGVPYFAGPLVLGPRGIVKTLPFGPVTCCERGLLGFAMPFLCRDIRKGLCYIDNASK